MSAPPLPHEFCHVFRHGGLLLSLVFHALLLTLQFGVPVLGLGLSSPFQPPPVSMTVMLAAPPLPAPGPSGMRLVDPAPPPVAPKPKPVQMAKRAKPAKPRRISRPVPAPTRVIARDQMYRKPLCQAAGARSGR